MGQAGRAGPDAGDGLAVPHRIGRRHAAVQLALVVGGGALEAADGDRFFLDAAAAAGRLARTVAGPPEDSREDVGLPVDHIGVGVPTLGDHPDVFGDRGMGRTGPLTIDHFMKVIRRLDIRRFQLRNAPLPPLPCLREETKPQPGDHALRPHKMHLNKR